MYQSPYAQNYYASNFSQGFPQAFPQSAQYQNYQQPTFQQPKQLLGKFVDGIDVVKRKRN